MQKRDSKSFDSGAFYRPDIEIDSNGTSSLERMDRIERTERPERMERPERSERSETKIMLPTPPVRPSPPPQQQTPPPPPPSAAPPTTNQCDDGSNIVNDQSKSDTNDTSDGLSDSNKDEKISSEPNEV